MKREVEFLMNPDNGAWSYEGANKALKKLAQKFDVVISPVLSQKDWGFGLEETYLLSSENEADINALIEEFEEWAKQLS